MSFYEESSIVITPNAYKAGTLYAVVPTSGAADMDVTRATAATRVDENGLVNYAEVIGSNLAICEDFECDDPNAVWTKDASWSIANGKASYNGVSNGHRIYQNIPLEIGKTYTASLDILDSSGNFRISVDGGTS